MARSEAEREVTKAARRADSRESTTPSIEGTPTPYAHPDQHSWVLQNIGEMREAVGGLKQAVQTLSDQSKGQSAKLDSISHKMYAATIVIGILVAGASWIIANLGSIIIKALDVISKLPTAK